MRSVLVALNLALIGMAAWLLWRWPEGQAKRFEDVEVVFILGGNRAPQQEYANQVYRGAMDASRDLGCRVRIRETGWTKDGALELLDSAVRLSQPDGICLIGFPRQEDFAPFVEAAFRKGIIVTSYSVAAPELIARFGGQGFGFVGEDLYAAGEHFARRTLEKWEIAAGSRVAVFGSVSTQGRGEIGQAAVDVYSEAGMVVDYLDLELARFSSTPQYVGDVAREYLAAHPEVRLMLVEATDIHFLVMALEELGVPPGRYLLAGLGLSANSLRDVERGYVGLLTNGSAYLHGYLPVLQICLTRKLGLGGMQVSGTAGYIDETNVAEARQILERLQP